MDRDRIERIYAQQRRTDQLLGLDMVPRYMVVPPQVPAERPAAPPPPPSRPPPPSPPAARPAPAVTLPHTTVQAPVMAALPTLDDLLSRARDPQARQTLLQELDEQFVRGCQRCGLCQGRTQTVFGRGSAVATLMFIGEGPGEQEDRQGQPFVGRAGEMLDRQIQAMGQYAADEHFADQKVYMANVVKCRPPQNRAPTPDEAEACWVYLQRQIAIVQPRVIVTLGGPATNRVLQEEQGITRVRGQWRSFQGPAGAVDVMPTFHPAYLLRAHTPENRVKVWSDLKAVVDRLRGGDA